MPITKVFLSGASGRMGAELKKIIDSSSEFEFAGGISQENVDTTEGDFDIVVDFSLPDAIPQVVDFCKKHKKPLVSGTTGLLPEHNSRLIELSKEVAVFWSANMSFGIFIMTQLIETLAKNNQGYKFQIEETHHTKKIDAPSGTAIMLEKVARSQGLDLPPTESIRTGDVFGIHVISATGAKEKIEISHEAFSRDLFAEGALKVARWLKDQRPGFYNMSDFFDKPKTD